MVAQRTPGFFREAQRVALTFLSYKRRVGVWVMLKSVKKKTTGALAARSDLAL